MRVDAYLINLELKFYLFYSTLEKRTQFWDLVRLGPLSNFAKTNPIFGTREYWYLPGKRGVADDSRNEIVMEYARAAAQSLISRVFGRAT
jgi:hypothetical protein